jgi:hypothetical protein
MACDCRTVVVKDNSERACRLRERATSSTANFAAEFAFGPRRKFFRIIERCKDFIANLLRNFGPEKYTVCLHSNLSADHPRVSTSRTLTFSRGRFTLLPFSRQIEFRVIKNDPRSKGKSIAQKLHANYICRKRIAQNMKITKEQSQKEFSRKNLIAIAIAKSQNFKCT